MGIFMYGSNIQASRQTAAMCVFMLCLLATSGAETRPENGSGFLSRITQPVKGVTWGMDSRSRWEYHNSSLTLQDGPDSEFSYLRLRNRLSLDIEPIRDLGLRARLITEPRYYFRPDSRDGWDAEEALIDELFAEAKNVFGLPLRLKAGRQEIHFGDRWILFDGTPGDGSRTEFFDAARLTLEASPQSTLDLVALWINSQPGDFLPVINDQSTPLGEQDEEAAVLYGSHRFSAAFQLDAHYIYRHISATRSIGEDGNLHVPGFRASGTLLTNWDYFAESAVQMGRKNGRDLAAWGFNGQIGFRAGGAWNHRFHLGYEYLSGDDPDSGQDEGWDPMWGRRARWSELMVFTFAPEAGGKRGYYSNLQRPNVGWTATPLNRLELLLNYSALLALTNPNRSEMFSEEGRFRGHLVQAVAKCRFSRNITAHLWNEVFVAGDFYAGSNRDTATFFRAEINLSF